MNNNIAIFIDIDGTLFNNRIRCVPLSTIEIIKKISMLQHIDLYISTGRPISTLQQVDCILPYFKGLNLANGQTIYIDHELVFEKGFSKKFTKRFLTFCEERKYPTGILCNDQLFMNFFEDDAMDNFNTYCNVPIVNLNHQPFNLPLKVNQFWSFTYEDDFNTITSNFPEVKVLKWGIYGADIIPSKAGKATGIKKISQIMGYKKENLYAIGDGENDISMFQVVKHSIAMGNASDYVKQFAKEITDHIDNNGLAKALEKIITHL